MRQQKRFCSQCGEQFELIKRDGRVRLYCGHCDCIRYENPLPATAAVVFNGDNRLLLVKRAMEPRSGEWCLPGGFVEIDESPATGVVRELAEETGLIGKVEGLIDCVYEESPFYGPLIIIGYQLSSHGGELRAGDDAAEVRYFSLTDLPQVAFDSHQTIIDKITRKSR